MEENFLARLERLLPRRQHPEARATQHKQVERLEDEVRALRLRVHQLEESARWPQQRRRDRLAGFVKRLLS